MEKHLSATERLLIEGRVSDEARRSAARLVRMFGEAHLGRTYDALDVGFSEHVSQSETLKQHVQECKRGMRGIFRVLRNMICKW